MQKSRVQLPSSLLKARIVGLGEPLHRCNEVHRQMGRLVNALLEDGNCRLILLENPVTQTDFIDRWVNGKIRASQSELERHLYGIWQTREFMRLLKEIRKFNLKNSSLPVRIRGIDIRQVGTDVEIIRKTLANKRELARLKRLNFFRRYKSWREIENRCLDGSKKDLRTIRNDLARLKKIKITQVELKDPVERIKTWLSYLSALERDWGKGLEIRDKQMYRIFRKRIDALPSDQTALLIGHALHLIPRSTRQEYPPDNYRLRRMLGESIGDKFGSKYRYIHVTLSQHSSLIPQDDTVEYFCRNLSAENHKLIVRIEDLQRKPTYLKHVKWISRFSVKNRRERKAELNQPTTINVKCLRKVDFVSFSSIG